MKEKYRDRALRALNQKKNQVLKRRFCGDFGAIKSKTPVSGRALANRYQRIYIANVPQMGGMLTDKNIAQGTEDGADSGLVEFNKQRQQILVSESKK
jgi:hypothetical protein